MLLSDTLDRHRKKNRGTSSKLTLNYYTDDSLIRSRAFLLFFYLKFFLTWLDFISDFQFNAFSKMYFIVPSLFYLLDTWKIRDTGIILNKKCSLLLYYEDFSCTFWTCVMYKTSIDILNRAMLSIHNVGQCGLYIQSIQGADRTIVLLGSTSETNFERSGGFVWQRIAQEMSWATSQVFSRRKPLCV